MKKLLILTLSLSLAFSAFMLTGCGNKNEEASVAEQQAAEEQQAADEENKDIYIGDIIDTKDIPSSDIGEIAMVASESKSAGVTVKNNLITIKESDQPYIYFEIEKGKSVECDVYADNKYIGQATLVSGKQKILLPEDAGNLGTHKIFFIGYRDKENKSVDTVTFFRQFNYEIVTKDSTTENNDAPETDSVNG